MGLLSKMTEKATKEWAQNLTPEQIEEYERQGMDMSEYKIIAEEHQAEQQRLTDAINLSMLDKYKKNRGANFIDEVAKFNKMSEKRKPKLETAPLVYGRVVQAHSALFKSNPKNKSGAGIVFLFALDDAHRYDEEWLAKTANRIAEMKESVINQPDSMMEKICSSLNLDNNFLFSITIGSMMEKKKVKFLPEDCRSFIRTLCNDSSTFGYKLGESLSDGADAWCATFSLHDQSKLPMAQIPQNRIIPFLLSEEPQSFRGVSDVAQLIPPAYYMK
ncbi:MAG: hypothetical protein LBI82_11260 [Dysgonamonadaceae bacterium]|jgi:hypothetical protein|nr:hypothetical protein [Dysgonamonadaceae bacterium]